MAEDQSPTPEQQLLKLIEESNKAPKGAAPSPGAPVPPTKIKRGGFSFAKISGVLMGRVAFAKRGARKRPTPRKMSIEIADANRLLYAAVAALLIYVVFDAVASAMALKRPANFVPLKEMKSTFSKESIEPLKETSYYLQKVSSRDIFREGKKVQQVEEQPSAENVMAEAAEVIQNLALVGISWSSNPDAIIEDKAHQRTFFVKRGQMVGDEVKVEAIFKDHVVVTFEDREYELR